MAPPTTLGAECEVRRPDERLLKCELCRLCLRSGDQHGDEVAKRHARPGSRRRGAGVEMREQALPVNRPGVADRGGSGRDRAGDDAARVEIGKPGYAGAVLADAGIIEEDGEERGRR